MDFKKRLPSSGAENTVEESVDAVIEPLIDELMDKGVQAPRTLLYCKLKWCGYTHWLASLVNEVPVDLIATYHSAL